MNAAPFVLFLHATASVLLGWLYFRRYAVQRPPIGVLNLRDTVFMLVAIILVPYLYLALPTCLLSVLLGLGTLSILYFTCEPVLRSRWLIWSVVIASLLADLGALLRFGPTSIAFLAVNNLLQVLAVVGVANLWAQSGMRARDAAVLGAGLIVYDGLFTSVLPLMGDLFSQVQGLPFAPQVAWSMGGEGYVASLGMGDLLVSTVFPLIMRKAYGRRAGVIALLATLGTLAALLALPAVGLLRGVFPVMVVLGPLMLVQYLVWRRSGPERTTWQYVQAEPRPNTRRDLVPRADLAKT